MLRRLSRIFLSTWIFIGLGLGLFVGLFFGELCRPLNFIGKAFLRLLQMAVLPYMVVSLIHGVGSLSPTDAKLMAGKGLTMVVLFWLVGLAVIFAFSLAFPVVDSSSFFSVSEPHVHEPYKILEQYIPSNIFEALSDSAVVLFSVFLGVALLRVRNNEPFLNIMSILAQALSQMTKMIIRTAPIGVFALTAVAAGTLSVDELQRLQVYFVCYILASFVLTFWVLPMLITTMNLLSSACSGQPIQVKWQSF
jgi:Na+/H+-dicarboxylate symporter